MLSKCSENSVTETIRQYVDSPILNYTWSRCTGQCQYCAKIKNMCKYNTFVGYGPFHNRSVTGPRVADPGPMNCRPSMALQ